MSRTIKCAEKAVVYAAKGAWVIYERLNRISPNSSFTPKWSKKPLPKSTNLTVQARRFQDQASVRLFRKLKNGQTCPTETGLAFITLAPRFRS